MNRGSNRHRFRSIGMTAVLYWALVAGTAGVAAETAAEMKIDLRESAGEVIVTADGKPFTQYVYAGHAKPILYPVIGPHGVPMTRNYPMVDGVDNEASDHPHHKSIWYTHDDVNGVKFWAEYDKNNQAVFGKIVQTNLKLQENEIHCENQWRSPDGEVVCSDSRVIGFGASPTHRIIDFAITLRATHGDAVFGDTKEGSMGIRTHPLLRLQDDKKRGNHTAKGQAVNSEGVEGKAMWGKRAKWVDYWAPIDGHTVGIAIMDHPSNPRHPTWWHARYYGLIAANPFGIHDFEKKPAGTGDMTIKAGESITFRYRFLLHSGDVHEANVAQQYDEFAK
ncbi:MAG: PmoA family protein [Pirellulaceae bacterium]|nr:PmoA family protein [Pirellulaceae bacterium]